MYFICWFVLGGIEKGLLQNTEMFGKQQEEKSWPYTLSLSTKRGIPAHQKQTDKYYYELGRSHQILFPIAKLNYIIKVGSLPKYTDKQVLDKYFGGILAMAIIIAKIDHVPKTQQPNTIQYTHLYKTFTSINFGLYLPNREYSVNYSIPLSFTVLCLFHSFFPIIKNRVIFWSH